MTAWLKHVHVLMGLFSRCIY